MCDSNKYLYLYVVIITYSYVVITIIIVCSYTITITYSSNHLKKSMRGALGPMSPSLLLMSTWRMPIMYVYRHQTTTCDDNNNYNNDYILPVIIIIMIIRMRQRNFLFPQGNETSFINHKSFIFVP